MQIAVVVAKQTFVMFLYMLVGYFLFRMKKLTPQGSKDIASMLVFLIIPTVIINSFCVEFSLGRLYEFLISTVLGAVSLVIAMLLARLFFRSAEIDQFSAAFSNAGFIGIPMVTAALGANAVFYLVGFIAMLNLLQWTYGVRLLTGEKGTMKLRDMALNPIMIAAMAGVILFISGIGARLPDVVQTTLRGIAALNAPLAMLVLGCYLAQSDLMAMVTTPRLYWLCAVRLVIIPAVTLLVFRFLPLSKEICMAVFIAAATPVGANVAVYAQLHGKDYPYACQTVTLTTLLSILSLPLMLMAAEGIL